MDTYSAEEYVSKLLILLCDLREEKKRLRRLRKKYRRAKTRSEKIEIVYQSSNPSVDVLLCDECLNFFSEGWMLTVEEFGMKICVCKTCYSFTSKLRREFKAFYRRYPVRYHLIKKGQG